MAESLFIFPEDTRRTSGKEALRLNIMAINALSEVVRTTLGPKGMDKMIVDTLGEITVTNDGFTILSAMSVKHPAAQMAVEAAKTQQSRIGDGTTTVVVLASELLRKAEELLDQNIHPTTVAGGYRVAGRKAHEILDGIAERIASNDEATLKKIATTAMTGKAVETSRAKLAQIVVSAVLGVAAITRESVDLDSIKVECAAASSADETELIEGVVLDRERLHPSMPSRVDNPKVALLDCPIEVPELETEAEIHITDPSQLTAFLREEGRVLEEFVQALTRLGVTSVFSQRGIQEAAAFQLAQAGVLAVSRVPKNDLEKVARATGGRIVADIRELQPTDLGSAGRIRQGPFGGRDMVFVEACKNARAVTIMACGGTAHAAEEVRRALDDAVRDVGAALRSGRVVGGAGAAEMEVARQLRDFAVQLPGRERMAVRAYADALEVIPRTLAGNAGIDPVDIMSELETSHEQGRRWAGIDVNSGRVVDSWEAGIIEPLDIKTQALGSATEVAAMVLRVDDVIASDGFPQDIETRVEGWKSRKRNGN